MRAKIASINFMISRPDGTLDSPTHMYANLQAWTIVSAIESSNNLGVLREIGKLSVPSDFRYNLNSCDK